MVRDSQENGASLGPLALEKTDRAFAFQNCSEVLPATPFELLRLSLLFPH